MEQFVKHYPGGYEELPSENTPVTAEVLDDIEQCLVDTSANNIILDNVTKYLTATAGSNGDFKVNITNTLATGIIVNITIPAATNGVSNARFSIDNGVNYKNVKNILGTQLIASTIASKNIIVYYNSTDFIVIDGIYTPATETEIATGTDENKIITPKELSDADLNTRLKSKAKEYTRDGTAASGDVSYTGVGFTPTSMRCIMTVNGTLYHSDGFSDSSKNSFGNTQTSSTTYYANNVFASYTDQNNWGQYCTVKSYDADGFTLTWTKAGAVPANTMQLKVICYK